jgi:hypothetical protein
MVVNCEHVWREISNYVDGEVDASLRVAMEAHFQACPRCRSVLEGTRNVVALYGDERMIDVPSGFSRRLERKIAQNAKPARVAWSNWSAWLVPVAALLLIAGGLRVASSSPLHAPMKSQHAKPAHDIPPDMTVVVTAGANLFHAPGCDAIHNKGTERTITAKEAMQDGYVPCPRCLRKYLDLAQWRQPFPVSGITETEVVEAENRDIARR